jgi:hypothetical protein
VVVVWWVRDGDARLRERESVLHLQEAGLPMDGQGLSGFCLSLPLSLHHRINSYVCRWLCVCVCAVCVSVCVAV